MAAERDKPCICLWLHGWGTTAGVWNELLPYLPPAEHHFVSWAGCRTPDDYRETAWNALKLAAFGSKDRNDDSDADVLLIGWSMGGMLALETAYRWQQHYRDEPHISNMLTRVICIGSCITFIDESKHQGWPRRVVERMRRQLWKEPEMVLQTFYQGFWSDEEKRQGINSHRLDQSLAKVVSGLTSLDAGLRYLMECDLNTKAWPCLARSGLLLLWLHGEQDTICIPPAEERLAPYDSLTYIQCPQKGHALLLSDPQRIGNLISDWLIHPKRVREIG